MTKHFPHIRGNLFLSFFIYDFSTGTLEKTFPNAREKCCDFFLS
jgi:hypothetical protein